jgi:hypothetical protein
MSAPPRRRSIAAGALLLALAGGGAMRAAEPQVALATGAGQWVRRDEPFEITLSAWPAATEGRLAVLLGDVDATELFRRSERGLAYRPELMPLAPGEREVAVYLVDPRGDWRQLARLPLRVLHPGGFEKLDLVRGLDLAGKATIDEEPARQGAAGRGRAEDATLQLGLEATLARRGWRLAPRLKVVGVTNQAEALRASTEGRDAPQVDLSTYALRLSRGRSALQVGAVRFDGERHLIAGFESRGLGIELPLGRRAEVALAAMNGTRIVGWDNPLGLEESRHQVLAGRLGFDLLPSRPGGLRVEASAVDGSLLPRFPFARAAVNDAEESRGWGLRLQGGTAGGRLRFDGGYARSRFDNPVDPLLGRGTALVPVESEQRDSRFAELALVPLRRAAPDGRISQLALSLKHERVAPQYRSVTVFTQADREQDTVELSAAWRGAALQLQAGEWRDNLDDLPNLLTTQSRRRAGSLTLPLAAMGRADARRPWLPALTYAYDRLHQAGAGIPPDSGFSASHVPDQVSTSHAAALEWQAGRARGGLRFGRSAQDNRQPGRESADFETTTRALFAGVALASLDLGVDLAHEELESLERRRLDRTRRYGLNLLWRLPKRMTFSAIASRQDGEDEPRTRRAESLGLDAQWAWQFERRTGWGAITGQLYLRYADQTSETVDRVFDVRNDFASRTLTTGMSLALR